VTFAFIDAEKASFPIAFMCDRLGVSRAGYYAWRARQVTPTPRMAAEVELTATIREIHAASRGTYGVPRVTAELRLGIGRPVNRKRVARLMASAGLQGLTRRKGWRRAKQDTVAFAEDLVARSFRPDRPDVLWVADITQHPTREGWVYCAVVIDAYSRLVVGHAIADHLRTELVIDAFDVANWRRRPAPGTIFHSDHGSQYVAWAFGRRLREAGLLASMGSVGDALDNAVAESFFASMQTELLDRRRIWDSRTQLANAMFEWIEVFYNRQRRHSTLGYKTPVDYDRTRPTAPAVAA
jgi:putative transposase